MIGLSVTTYDLNGARYFYCREINPAVVYGNRQSSRRVSRSATLDGSCVVSDLGYSAADRSVTLECPGASNDIIEFMDYMVQTYSLIGVSMEDGFFTGVPESFRVSNGSATMTILLTGEA